MLGQIQNCTTHLSLGQVEHFGQLSLPSDRNVPVKVEFLFELQTLQVGVHDPVLVFGASSACER